MENHNFQKSVDKILLNVCLAVNFTFCVKVLTFRNFPKLPKTCYVRICFNVLNHYGVNTLRVVERFVKSFINICFVH